MRKIFNLIIKILPTVIPVLIIIGIDTFLLKVNYIPGTWLSGWDSTQPELNLKGHLIRDFSSVWQEYRGLGVLDGMAHGANLVHLLYVWFLSLVLPPNMIRYVFVMIMHAVGGIGAFVLIRYLLKAKLKLLGTVAAFVGAIFYLFNPGTIQMFYAPLELFIIHFGFLPWLLWALFKYLDNSSKFNLLIFAFLNVLALSQAHVPTIFIVYLISVLAFLFFLY